MFDKIVDLPNSLFLFNEKQNRFRNCIKIDSKEFIMFTFPQPVKLVIGPLNTATYVILIQLIAHHFKNSKKSPWNALLVIRQIFNSFN